MHWSWSNIGSSSEGYRIVFFISCAMCQYIEVRYFVSTAFSLLFMLVLTDVESWRAGLESEVGKVGVGRIISIVVDIYIYISIR